MAQLSTCNCRYALATSSIGTQKKYVAKIRNITNTKKYNPMLQLNQPYKVAIKVSGNRIRNAQEWKKAVIKFAKIGESNEIRCLIYSHVRSINHPGVAELVPMHGYLSVTAVEMFSETEFNANIANNELTTILPFGVVTYMDGQTYEITVTAEASIVASVHGSTANHANHARMWRKWNRQ